MRGRRFAVLIGFAGAALWAPVASAAVPVTTITIQVTFGVDDEPFTTTGGVVCPSGIAVTDPVFVAGFSRPTR